MRPTWSPFRMVGGHGFVWVLTRTPGGCSSSGECFVIRVDPRSNRVVGRSIGLPGDAWDLTAGRGWVWVTQSSGDIVRVDGRVARIASRISACPVYFGSAIVYGNGFIFTGN